MAANGQGCGAISSTSAAPDVAGTWSIAYGDGMQVDVSIGGAVYHQMLAKEGGSFSIDHAGTSLSFNVDCSRPEVICPSEVWPNQVTIDQHDPMYPHRMWVDIPTQSCSVPLRQPSAPECGANTLDPDCKPVCDGTLTTSTAQAFGVIADDGGSFDLLLGGGAATNGINCALLGVSTAHATLVDQGSGAAWQATAMQNGTVQTAYAGGCLWAGDASGQALVVGASLTLTTPFTGTKLSSSVDGGTD